MKVIQKLHVLYMSASKKSASRFSEDLKNAHLLFLHLSKICITIYEGLSNVHLL